MCNINTLDNVLVAVNYYIGVEKEFTGAFPFLLLTFVAAGCMVSSEIIAWKKKKKISPAQSMIIQRKKMVISNLIPFTRLNLIFAFSALVTCAIGMVWGARVGVPFLSIHIVVMLVLLLVTNKEAMAYFKRKFAGLSGVDMGPNLHNQSQGSRNEQGLELDPRSMTRSPSQYAVFGTQSAEEHSNLDTNFGQESSPVLPHNVNRATNQGEIVLQVHQL